MKTRFLLTALLGVLCTQIFTVSAENPAGRNGVGSRFRPTVNPRESRLSENDSRPRSIDSTKKYLAGCFPDETSSPVDPAQPEPADAVYLDPKVHTVDERFRIAEAFAIRAERFLDVGTNEDVRRYIGPRTAVIQLPGSPVLPGLIDTRTRP